MCVIEDRIEDWMTNRWSDGRASGWNDGILEGQVLLIQRLFQSGMKLEEIVRISQLPQETLVMIQNNMESLH